ncbi:DNA repair helicase [Spraguea lophii 42_110]|uniref:DNA 5'-3' helicase n=1 Tax=Spraguea lophii (strain 42_110) TaxID=1358809 RepID=S7WDD9_SPRLO|nr:DNA repair helicase [Spraguea lophii 42_110]
MHKLKINSIEITLPYAPYAPQIMAMSSILTSIQTNTPAAIESPTGTGKSFSILCSSLAYANSVQNNGKPLKIFICSRTHKQLDQLVSQLKMTVYRPTISVLASRNLYCVNSKNTGDKNVGCKNLVRENKCVYYNYREKLVKSVLDGGCKSGGVGITDIEEFKSLGKKMLACPYYASRSISEKSVVTFAPYNYLLDPSIRTATGINIKDAIVIIDEAHNIEDVCRATGSLEISSLQLEISMNEILFLYKRKLKDEGKDEALIIINFMQRIRKYAENKINGTEENKDDIFAITNENNVKNITNDVKNVTNDVKDIENSIKDTKEDNKSSDDVKKELLKMCIDSDVVTRISKAIKILRSKEVLSNHTLHLIEAVAFVFKLILNKGKDKEYAYEFVNENSYNRKSKYNYKLNFILLDSSIIFKPLVDNTKTVILLSGTLSPFNIIGDELDTKFRTVIAPSIVNNKNIFIRSISYDGNTQLKNTYQNNNNPNYIKSVAHTVQQIHKNTNGGTIVFVPSYHYLENIKNKLQALNNGRIYTEPNKSGNNDSTNNFDIKDRNDKNSLDGVLKLYRSNIKHNPLLLAVYRGKVSEGIDFSDEYCRNVIAIGLPYSNTRDFSVMSKKIYNDKKNGTGNLWYEINSFRAINQALGRVIRHKDDYGAVFLIDSRYTENRVKNFLSSWVKNNLISVRSYEQCKEEYKCFVEQMKKNKIEKKNVKKSIIEKYISIENITEKNENKEERVYNKNYNVKIKNNILDTNIKEGIKRIKESDRSSYIEKLSKSNETEKK